jgi:hypothetical protein
MHQLDDIATKLLGLPFDEIMLLHDKIDQLRERQWEELLEIQKQQLALLTGLIEKRAQVP